MGGPRGASGRGRRISERLSSRQAAAEPEGGSRVLSPPSSSSHTDEGGQTQRPVQPQDGSAHVLEGRLALLHQSTFMLSTCIAGVAAQEEDAEDHRSDSTQSTAICSHARHPGCARPVPPRGPRRWRIARRAPRVRYSAHAPSPWLRLPSEPPLPPPKPPASLQAAVVQEAVEFIAARRLGSRRPAHWCRLRRSAFSEARLQ